MYLCNKFIKKFKFIFNNSYVKGLSHKKFVNYMNYFVNLKNIKSDKDKEICKFWNIPVISILFLKYLFSSIVGICFKSELGKHDFY